MTDPANAAAPFDTTHIQANVQDFAFSSIGWMRSHWLELLISGAAALVIALALYAVRGWGMRFCRKHPGVTGWRSIFGRAIARTGHFFIVMVAARLVTIYADAPPVVATTIGFLFTVAAVFQSAVWAREIILGFVELRTDGDTSYSDSLSTALGLIRVLVTVALFSIALIVVLSNLGVNVTGLVAGLGVGGIAIGLAAQGIFSDLFAALSIIFDKPFRRGDSISYDNTNGSIEAIGLKSTRVRSFTGEERIISNRNLLDKEIVNNTLRVHRRGKFAVGVPGGAARSATHFAMATSLDPAQVVLIAAREGWPVKYRKRGAAFGVLELWIEGTRMVEVLTPEMQREYLDTMRIDGWLGMLESMGVAA